MTKLDFIYSLLALNIIAAIWTIYQINKAKLPYNTTSWIIVAILVPIPSAILFYFKVMRSRGKVIEQ